MSGIKGNQENQIREANSVATYLNYELQYKGLKISPGIRHESIRLNISNYGTADVARLGTSLQKATNQIGILLPGIGLNLDLTEQMNLFGGIHKGFSPPGMPTTNLNTSQARAETAINYELGYRFERKGIEVQCTGFISEYDNILGSDNISGGGAGTGDMFNAGHAHISGVEFGLTYDLLQMKKVTTDFKLPISIAYTFTHARFDETFVNGGGDWGSGQINRGDFIPFITPHMLTLTSGIEYKQFNATLTARYTGETRIRPGKDAIVVPDRNIKYTDVNALSGYLIMDLSANYSFSRILTAYTMINNLTDNRAIVANLPQGYRPNMPLSIAVGLKCKL